MTKQASAPPPPIEALEAALLHRFSDRALLAAALRHSSLSVRGGRRQRSGAEFERLEFLGDRVVGLVVADLLLKAFPGEPEGALAQRHATLVSRDTLADVAQSIRLGQHLQLARGEEQAGGRDRPGVIADALEAVIGALYRDGGLEAAAAFIERQWAPRIERADGPPRDPKTALQEWAQGRGLPLPSYSVTAQSGPPHAPSFKVQVAVEGIDPASAEGPSKQKAERAAAEALLQRLGVSA